MALLESAEIISRERHHESKAKVLYRLTPKGIDLIPVMMEFILWSEKNYEVHTSARQFARLYKKDKEGIVKGIYQRLKIGY